jgi:hypothetical protein
MALVSPGSQVTIVDQSTYVPAQPNSIPLIIMATAQNKTDATSTSVASGTTAANAGKLYRVTSQRDLVTLFGNPFFYKTTNGTPIHGYELNEYGLQAAYSVLGASNMCYVIRADVDLADLIGKTGRPVGQPSNGSYWLDLADSSWGIFEFNAATGKFTSKSPLVLTDVGSTDGTLGGGDGQPSSELGNIGDYAVVVPTYDRFNISANPTEYHTYWFKNMDNEWVPVGGDMWKQQWPTVQGTKTVTTVRTGNLVINDVEVTIPANATLAQVVTAINTEPVPFVTAEAIDGRLCMFLSNGDSISLAGSATNPLADLGLEDTTTYYAPKVFWGTNAEQPRWRDSDPLPRPTGSVWIKTNAANRGISLNLSQYSSSADAWSTVPVSLKSSDWTASLSMDVTGGSKVPAGTVYAQYGFGGDVTSPLQLFIRVAEGEAVFVGGLPSSATGPFAGATLRVKVSVPGSADLSDPYTVSMPAVGAPTASDFVTAWTAANIPNTRAEVAVSGNIVLTHTAGGEIILDGTDALISAFGFGIGDAPAAKWGPFRLTNVFNDVEATGGTGDGATFDVNVIGYIPEFDIASGGTDYAVGEELTMTVNGDVFKVVVTSITGAGTGPIDAVAWSDGFATPEFTTQLSNWRYLQFMPSATMPAMAPTEGTNWFHSVVDQVDIMVNVGGEWMGYRNVTFAPNGMPSSSGPTAPPSPSPATNPTGPIISASTPGRQTDGTSLAYGDLWIDTGDLENYPAISRWENVDGMDQWVAIDNTDQETEKGIVFGDARWSATGDVDPAEDAVPTIVSLLTSDRVDLDCVDATLYPHGTLLFNTRRSGYNVKQYRSNYFTAGNFPDADLPTVAGTWITVSGNNAAGAALMGRKAQRSMVVQAMKAAINTNSGIREEDTFFNLIAAPGYPELQADMITLNNDRSNTAYIVGDTPMRLAADANAITDWATNAMNAVETGEDGMVNRDTYLGVYYPSGLSSDLTGAQIVVPASHMMLRTMLYNDTVAYPWFAPAGQRRGVISNASNIGYIDSASGEFVADKNRNALRDVEYTNFINPIAFFTNVGLLSYGNKNTVSTQSALDRTNVARLIAYLRERLHQAVRPFIFEPNDTNTRSEAAAVCATLLNDIQSKRGIYDYLVVCDTTNNTPARIDRNELWIDIAIEPTKAVEFIYIPVRILNTGEISGLGTRG